MDIFMGPTNIMVSDAHGTTRLAKEYPEPAMPIASILFGYDSPPTACEATVNTKNGYIELKVVDSNGNTVD